MSYLEVQLRDSARRDMVLGVMMQCAEVNKVAEWSTNLAKAFRVNGDVGGAEWGVVPFGRASDVKGYLGEIRGMVCERFHEHAEAEGMMGEKKEGWFFDSPLR
jgi:hypothetical protein